MKITRRTLSRLGALALLMLTFSTANAQSAAELNGDWQGENSGNRVRIEMSGNGVTVGTVSNNPGQSSGATLWVARGSGQYTYAFPDGKTARLELIGPDRIRVSNPDGWTDTFRRYSKPAAPAKAATASNQPSTDQLDAKLALENNLFLYNLRKDQLKMHKAGDIHLSSEELAVLDCELKGLKEELARYIAVLAGSMTLSDARNEYKFVLGRTCDAAPSKEKTPPQSVKVGYTTMVLPEIIMVNKLGTGCITAELRNAFIREDHDKVYWGEGDWVLTNSCPQEQAVWVEIRSSRMLFWMNMGTGGAWPDGTAVVAPAPFPNPLSSRPKYLIPANGQLTDHDRTITLHNVGQQRVEVTTASCNASSDTGKKQVLFQAATSLFSDQRVACLPSTVPRW